MKILNAILFILLLSLPGHVHAQAGFGRAVPLNHGWEFTLDDPAAPPTEYFREAQWTPVKLPHDWSVGQPLSPSNASSMGFLPGGIGWYRHTLDITPAQGEKYYIYFEGVYNRSEVFLNGQLLGTRPNGYISFMYDLTPYLDPSGGNLLEVRVDHSSPADARWYTGAGIYRNVWLVESAEVHIAPRGVFTYPSAADRKSGILAVEVEVENGTDRDAALTVVNELAGPDGRIAASAKTKLNVSGASKGKINLEMKVKEPLLWDLDNPNLYKLTTTVVSSDGREIDKSVTATGFRTFRFDPDHGFFLNGDNMKIKGVCLHHDAGVLGAAVPAEVWEQRLMALKSLGCNAVRTSHNPQSPDFYDICDRIGMLVLDEAYDEWEFPKRKWIEGWNVGTPGLDGTYDIFAEWGELDLEDFIRRDRNHISVFAWSIGNEVDYPNDPYSHPVLDEGGEGFTQATFGGYRPGAPDAMRLGTIAGMLAEIVRRTDPSRPVTAGLAGVAMSNETDYPFVLDIAGYNYTESRYATDHIKYPDRVIYGSENRHDYAAWKAVRDNEHIFGQFLWTGIDYLGESHRWPSRGFGSGLIDLAGFVKPLGMFRKALWTEEPMIYIGTYPVPRRISRDGTPYLSTDAEPVWNYSGIETVWVVCYTNTAQAELYLNGTVAGEMKPFDDTTGIIFWDIPWSPGELTAVGYDDSGREATRYTVRTSGRSHCLKVLEYDDRITAGKGLSQIALEVVDRDGVPVILADDEIICHVEGPGRLLGVESGDNRDMSDYTDNAHRVYKGRLRIYVASEGEGDIKVGFQSRWLEPLELIIKSE